MDHWLPPPQPVADASVLSLSLSLSLQASARVLGGEGSGSEKRVWGFGVWESQREPKTPLLSFFFFFPFSLLVILANTTKQ